MNLDNKRIGIWGFGIVGKAACNYFYSQAHQLEVLNAKELTAEEQKVLARKNIPWNLQENHLNHFLEQNDYILPSPGIDLRPYAHCAHKWITELDLIQENFKKPVIAVTGSVGKTSVTTILSQILQSNDTNWYTGGNIGAGMLELISDDKQYDAALLEVSSFQLEHCRTFAPNLAIWTTFYQNHLDRHGTMQAYFDAKFSMIAHQRIGQVALLPSYLMPFVANKSINSSLNFFSNKPMAKEELKQLPKNSKLFCFEENSMVVYDKENRTVIYDSELPHFSFKENWLIVISSLYLLHHELGHPDYMQNLEALCDTIKLPEHRLEKITLPTKPNMIFYNDSKSTTIESTLAAVNQIYGGAPITIFLGGLSKGVNREPLIKALKEKVVAVYCFGKEAEQLKNWAGIATIASFSFARLEDAVLACLQNTKEPAQILFSPAGSSYDLFKDYQERGMVFKKLIQELCI